MGVTGGGALNEIIPEDPCAEICDIQGVQSKSADFIVGKWCGNEREGKRMMIGFGNKRRLALLVLMSLAVALCIEAAPPLQTLEELVGQWVDLRGQADTEERTWQAQELQLQQETELLAAEQARLTAALEALEEAGETRQERDAVLLERRKVLASSLSDVEGILSRLEPALLAVRAQVPAVLLAPEQSAALNAPFSSGDRGGTVTGLQRFLGALRLLEELQNGIHTTRELVRLPEDVTREMEILYLGLVTGIGVTADGKVTAIGRPVEGEWDWKESTLSGADVQRLIRMARKDAPPVLVSFPIAFGLDFKPQATEIE